MNHIDEGTIHAWLDGELDVARARVVREHVDGCASCSALVAESRGLMAGASRILSALDDVPAKVTPIRAPAPATRQWRAAPWVSGIAAAAILAVGITTWQRERTDALPTAESMLLTLDSVQPTAAQPTPAVAPAPAPPQPRPVAGVPSTRRDAAQQRAAAGAGGAGGRDAVGELAGPPAPAPRPESRAVADAPSALAPKTTAAATAAADESKDVKREADPKSVMLKSSALGDAAFYGSGLSEFVGCYRLTARPRENVIARTVEAAGAVAATAARNRAAAPTAAPAPTAQLVAPAPPSYVRLDTVKHPLGYIARAAGNDSAIGTWNRVGTDSVRVDLLVRGLFTLTRSERIGCPE